MPANLQLVTSQHLAALHDANLVGVTFSDDECIALDFLTTTRERKSLRLNAVVNFFCSGMLEGNIVASVEIIGNSKIDHEDRQYFVQKEGRGQTPVQLENAIASKGLVMLLISPSYGAEIGCVCESAELE